MKNEMKSFTTAFLLLSSLSFAELTFKDTKGKYLDVLNDGKVVTRYMYEHDTSTEEKHKATYKPYLHVFDAEGKAPITKGAGGKFPHHRGLFVGWSKIGYNGKIYDRWHMKGGDMIHQEFTAQETDGVKTAAFASTVHWMDEKGEPFIKEDRRFAVLPKILGKDEICFIVMTTELTAIKGDVSLKGDPEHAGVQFRPADAVEKEKTEYLFPSGVKNVKREKDMPWAAENFVLGGKKYGVVHLNHPRNPKGTVYSAYRDYGRFGAFFEKDIPKGESLEFAYGIYVVTGDLPERKTIDLISEQFGKMLGE